MRLCDRSAFSISTLFAAWLLCSSPALAQEALQLSGPACTEPPWLHCPAEGCPADRVINPGPVVETETRRTYFLDYPCDLERGEEVTLVLSLHGAGSYANWQRHYFPLLDWKDEYRLVIATPSTPVQFWLPEDDAYLRNIVESLTDQIGAEHIRAFWLAGHSQGGLTSNRLLRTPFFAERTDGWLSLSGGRLGGNPALAADFGPPSPQPSGATPAVSSAPSEAQRTRAARFAELRSLLASAPEADFSFIYTTGERELAPSGVPEASSWAEKYACGPRSAATEIADETPGYVYDSGRQSPGRASWGLLPGPGTARLHVYPECEGGRVVADVIRLAKGHTEGLEPEVTEAIVKLMVSAPGGKLRSR